MSVTYQMVFEELGVERSVLVEADASPRFLAVGDGRCPLPRADGADALVVADAGTCLAALSAQENLHALCICRGAVLPELGRLRATGRCAVVDTPMEPWEAFSRVSALFQEMLGWELALSKALLDGAELSQILDLSAPVLDCPLVMSGVGLRLIAHSSNLMPGDAHMLKAIEQGYFDDEQIEYFREYGMPELWNSAQGVILVERTTPYRDYPLIFYIFRVHGKYYLHLTVHGNRRPLSDGLIDRLRVLIDAIELYVKTRPPASDVFNEGVSAHLARLVQDGARVTRDMRHALAAAGVDDATPFRLHVVDYGYDDDERQIAHSVAMDLLMRVPGALVTVVGARCVVLEPNPGEQASVPAALEAHAATVPCVRGESDTCSGLEEARYAFQQAQAACDMAARLGAPPGSALAFTRVFASYCLLGEECDRQFLLDCLERSIPLRLREEDAQAGTDDFDVLREYLACERNAAEAARNLYLHRSSLVYRIRRIEQSYGISLGDADVRARLDSEFRLANMFQMTK